MLFDWNLLKKLYDVFVDVWDETNHALNVSGPSLDALSLGIPSAHKAACSVPQTTAAKLVATSTPCSAVRISSPNGEDGSTTNSAYVAIGGSGLTLANAVVWLGPGDGPMEIPCDDASNVYVVSSASGQTLRWEVLS